MTTRDFCLWTSAGKPRLYAPNAPKEWKLKETPHEQSNLKKTTKLYKKKKRVNQLTHKYLANHPRTLTN